MCIAYLFFVTHFYWKGNDIRLWLIRTIIIFIYDRIEQNTCETIIQIFIGQNYMKYVLQIQA